MTLVYLPSHPEGIEVRESAEEIHSLLTRHDTFPLTFAHGTFDVAADALDLHPTD